jgi:hypothetical protein
MPPVPGADALGERLDVPSTDNILLCTSSLAVMD